MVTPLTRHSNSLISAVSARSLSWPSLHTQLTLSKVWYILCSILGFSLTLLLGMDVCGFAQFKAELQKIKLQLAFESDLRIDKSNILHIIEVAYKKAFTKHNITAGWRKTGIYPFNPAVITPTMMAPAQKTSTANTFPGATPYAVKKIHDWIHPTTPRTSHSSSPSSPIATTNSAANATTPTTPPLTIQSTSSSCPIPLPPALSFLEDTEIGPALQGSIVNSSLPLPVHYQNRPAPISIPPIPPPPNHHHPVSPETLLAQNSDLRNALQAVQLRNRELRTANNKLNIQCGLQHHFLGQYKKKLNSKEKKKKSKRYNLYKDGQGLILTSNKAREEVAKNKAAREATIAGKAACAEARKESALNKVCTKDQNTRLRGQYEVEKAAYENWVAELRADGVPVKQLPAKPWWPFTKRSREDWEQSLTAEEMEFYSHIEVTVEDSPDSESWSEGEGSTEVGYEEEI